MRCKHTSDNGCVFMWDVKKEVALGAPLETITIIIT